MDRCSISFSNDNGERSKYKEAVGGHIGSNIDKIINVSGYLATPRQPLSSLLNSLAAIAIKRVQELGKVVTLYCGPWREESYIVFTDLVM